MALESSATDIESVLLNEGVLFIISTYLLKTLVVMYNQLFVLIQFLVVSLMLI